MNRELHRRRTAQRVEPPTPSRDDLLLLHPGLAWSLGIDPAPTGVKPPALADAASEVVIDPAKLA